MHEFMAPNNVDARVAATIRGGGNGEIYAPRARSIPTPRDSRNKKFNVSFIAWQMLNLPDYRHSRMHPLSLSIYIYSNINVYMRLTSIIVYDYYINFYAERRKDLSVKIHSNSNCSSIYIYIFHKGILRANNRHPRLSSSPSIGTAYWNIKRKANLNIH